jgi:hypothetical protein
MRMMRIPTNEDAKTKPTMATTTAIDSNPLRTEPCRCVAVVSGECGRVEGV